MGSSTVIEELANHSHSQSSFANAYFYFDFNDTEKQLSKNLIRTQLSAQCSICPVALLRLHSHHQGGSRQPKTGDLIDVLKHLMETFQAVFIVADALDECTDRDDLLDFIEMYRNTVFQKIDERQGVLINNTAKRESSSKRCTYNGCQLGGTSRCLNTAASADRPRSS